MAQSHKAHRANRRRYYQTIVSAAIITLLIVVLIPQTDVLWRGLEVIPQADPALVGLALAMTAMTYILSGEIYHLLLKHPLPLRQILLVQAATALTSRIVPIGVGTMGLNALFLRRRNHTTAEALAVVATNNGIGIAGHILLLAAALGVASLPSGLQLRPSWAAAYWVLLVITLGALVLALAPRWRRRTAQAFKNLGRALASYRHRPQRLLAALAITMALSSAYVLALAATAQALGLQLTIGEYFLVYSFSLAIGAATPTPGGIVGVEAGLVAGLIAYGTAADTALAVALLYRIITYWLPLLPGFVALRVVQRRYF